MISSLASFEMRTLNARSGVAAYGTISAVSTASCRLGMRSLAHGYRAAFERGKESANLSPHFRASGKPMPVRSNQADQLVAFVDGNHVILRLGVAAGVAGAIDEEGGDVGLHIDERGIGLFNLSPGLKGQ